MESLIRLAGSPQVDSVVILAEMTWDGAKMADFSGLDVLRRLRSSLDRPFTKPVVVTSFMPESYFWGNRFKSPSFAMLMDPGTSFVRLPTTLDRIRESMPPPLPIDVWHDVRESLCDGRGLVLGILHRLKNDLMGLSDETREQEDAMRIIAPILVEAFTAISDIVGRGKNVEEAHRRMLDDCRQALASDRKRSLAMVVEEHQDLIFANFESPVEEVRTSARNPYPWIVLLVEDDAGNLKKTTDVLTNEGLNVIPAADPEAALRILRADEPLNQIAVVIADYRLERQEPKGKWYPLQGYALLREISATSSCLLSLFALTAADRRMTQTIQNRYDISVRIYTKQLLWADPSYLRRLISDIVAEGQRVHEAVISLPGRRYGRGDSWARFKPFYRMHRAARDFGASESKISKSADEFLTLALRNDVAEVASRGLRFGGAARDLESFRLKLLGRRIAVGLFVNQRTAIDVYFALQSPPILGEDVESHVAASARGRSLADGLEIVRNRARSFISENLALGLESDIPEHLLPEERAWLRTSSTIGYWKREAEICELIQNAWSERHGQAGAGSSEEDRSAEARTVKMDSISDLQRFLNWLSQDVSEIEAFRSALHRTIAEREDPQKIVQDLVLLGLDRVFEQAGIWPVFDDNSIITPG